MGCIFSVMLFNCWIVEFELLSTDIWLMAGEYWGFWVAEETEEGLEFISVATILQTLKN